MWLKDSSIGRKFVMALSGAALVFFLLFHGCMNLALVFSEEAYNAICRFLGANWYAVIGSLGIAFLILVHFCYGLYLTIQNRAARGNDRYAVTDKKPGVTWESENMLVLGFTILGFLCLHLYNFWFKMQFAELSGIETAMTSMGLNNLKWQKRIEVISTVVATLVVLPFTIVVLYYLGMGIGMLCA